MEDARCVVEHGVDAHHLLEDAEHNAHEDDEHAVGEHGLGTHGNGVLDVLQNLRCLLSSVDFREDAQGPLVAAYHHEVARCLRYEADEEGKQACRHGLRAEHIAPARLDGPRVAAGDDGVHALSYRLDDGVGMLAEDEEVDEVDHQLSEDDGKLVPRHEHASDVRRCHLADIHRADGRCQSYADAADDAVDVEGDEQAEGGMAFLKEEKLGRHAAQGGDEEEDSRQDERPLAAEP